MQPTLFINHGGGPYFFLKGGPTHDGFREMEAYRARFAGQLTDAPSSRHAQPEEDHLLPLMVMAGGASGEHGHTECHGQALGKPISGFRFGN